MICNILLKYQVIHNITVLVTHLLNSDTVAVLPREWDSIKFTVVLH